MRKLVFLVMCILSMREIAFAQTQVLTPGAVLVWDQPPSPGDPVLPNAFEYRLSTDGAPAVVIAPPPTCTAPAAPATNWRCQMPVPAFTPGTHTLVVSAHLTYNGATYDSQPSATLTLLTIFVYPPANLRIEPGGGGQVAEVVSVQRIRVEDLILHGVIR